MTTEMKKIAKIMGDISESDFQKMPKNMRIYYDKITNWLLNYGDKR